MDQRCSARVQRGLGSHCRWAQYQHLQHIASAKVIGLTACLLVPAILVHILLIRCILCPANIILVLIQGTLHTWSCNPCGASAAEGSLFHDFKHDFEACNDIVKVLNNVL